MKVVAALAAGAAGIAMLSSGVAGAFPGPGHHHGSPALMACMVAAPESVKANLKSVYQNSSLKADHQALMTAHQNLTQRILAKNTNLTEYETAVSQAELKMTQDEDAIAQNVCGQLSAAQLSAATTLYNNLQSNRQTMRGYFQAAHQASGSTDTAPPTTED
jgi:hypothetical protein